MMRAEKMKFLILGALSLIVSGLSSCSARPDDKILGAYAKASVLFESGKFAEAAAAAVDGNVFGFNAFAPAALLRGKALWFQGNSEESEKALRSALRARSSSVETRIWLARTLRTNRKPKEAAAVIEEALADDPTDPRALRLASELAASRGDAAAARSLLDRAAESGAELGLVFLDRARLMWAAGEGKKALEDIGAAAAVLPPDGAAYRAARALEKAVREASL